MNTDRNPVLSFTTYWFNQLDQTDNFFNQISIPLFIKLGPFKQASLDYKT